MSTSHQQNDFDVIVIGGGFAGLVAARDLADEGRSVLVLEARDRLGGRTWTRAFADTDVMIELGGQWIEPERQHNLSREIERYGVEVEHSSEPRAYPTLLEGQRNPGPMPIPWEEVLDLERAIFHCQKAASRIDPTAPLDQQGLADLDVPWSDFMAPLNLPPSTFDYVTALAALYMARYPEDFSALAILAQLAKLDLSAFLMWGVIDVRFANGTKSLIDAIASDCPDIRLDTPVVRVAQSETGVVVTTAADDELTARRVIVATPVNCWNDISFEPAISDVKRQASADRHGTPTCGKYFALTRGAQDYPYMIAGPRATNGLIALSQDAEVGDDQLMLGFICDPDTFDVTTFEGVERALKVLDPNAHVVKSDAHDWNSDPYSKGGWFAPRPGLLSTAHTELGRPEGRVLFATSDVALGFQGWMDGAVESGHRAASSALRMMEREAVAFEGAR